MKTYLRTTSVIILSDLFQLQDEQTRYETQIKKAESKIRELITTEQTYVQVRRARLEVGFYEEQTATWPSRTY